MKKVTKKLMLKKTTVQVLQSQASLFALGGNEAARKPVSVPTSICCTLATKP